jgi:hypothetical protein
LLLQVAFAKTGPLQNIETRPKERFKTGPTIIKKEKEKKKSDCRLFENRQPPRAITANRLAGYS